VSKKRKRVTLPRVTLLAFSRQDLIAFVAAVEALRGLVHDLRTVAADLKLRAVKHKPKKPATEEQHWERVNPNANPSDPG
jgi:hypothetical protein